MSSTENRVPGCYDADGRKLAIGQAVKFLDIHGVVTFESGAYGIAFDDPIDWTRVKNKIEPTSGYMNRLNACMNDHFISFWEIIWNFDDEEGRMSAVEVIN